MTEIKLGSTGTWHVQNNASDVVIGTSIEMILVWGRNGRNCSNYINKSSHYAKTFRESRKVHAVRAERETLSEQEELS